MQIFVDKNNLITSYAITGGFDGGVEIDDNVIPQDFIQNYKPKYYLYQNGKIFLNENYSEEVSTPVQPPIVNTPGTDEELRKMFASMQVQLVQANMMVIQLSQQNARLSQEMVVINQKIDGGSE